MKLSKGHRKAIRVETAPGEVVLCPLQNPCKGLKISQADLKVKAKFKTAFRTGINMASQGENKKHKLRVTAQTHSPFGSTSQFSPEN